MKSESRVRVAVVGLGWVCQHRHLPIMRRDRNFELVGAIDRDGTLARMISKRYGMPCSAGAESLNQVEWIDRVDAITIATAPSSHYQLARQALMLGKHVLTEKPFTLSLDEGRELADLATSKSLTLAVVHNFQFSESFRQLEADLGGGRLGKVTSIVARQFSNPRRRLPTWYESLPMGLFYDESPHLLYLIRRACRASKVELVRANAVRSTTGARTPALIEALYVAMLDQRACPVSLLMSFEAPVSEWHFCVMGEEAMAAVDLFRDIYIRIPNDGGHGAASVLRTSLWATVQHWGQHLTRGVLHLSGRLMYGNDMVFRKFAAAVLKGERPSDIDSVDAEAVLGMQHELIRSVRWIG